MFWTLFILRVSRGRLQDCRRNLQVLINIHYTMNSEYYESMSNAAIHDWFKCFLLENFPIYLVYPSFGWSVVWLVCWFVCRNFLKGRQVTLPFSYRSTYFKMPLYLLADFFVFFLFPTSRMAISWRWFDFVLYEGLFTKKSDWDTRLLRLCTRGNTIGGLVSERKHYRWISEREETLQVG